MRLHGTKNPGAVDGRPVRLAHDFNHSEPGDEALLVQCSCGKRDVAVAGKTFRATCDVPRSCGKPGCAGELAPVVPARHSPTKVLAAWLAEQEGAA